ncbi:MAG: acyltransferase family protein [Akkermansiaceae bacterium]
MTGARYRPEIDGLRAIAVIAVLLYHFGLSVPGGFIGVDVFFVISGFLITGILQRQLREGRFSLGDFWARRIRRIAPAAVAMSLGTLAMGWHILDSSDYRDLARSLMAHVFFASNCYFNRDQGYFTESAEKEPLLHTWSLSVEEQFYLLFPLLLLFLWRFARAKVPFILGVIALLSLAGSAWQVHADQKAAFFLLPARAWELLAGALLAFKPVGKPHRSHEALSLLGLTLIFVPMALFEKATLFPGLNALPPVLGTVLFIATNEARLTRTGRLLAARPMISIGLISYSLYLWHWPLVAYVNVMVIEVTLPWKIGMLLLSVILGILSWRFIERPFRSGALLTKRRSSYAFGASTLIALWMVAFSIRTLVSSGGSGVRDFSNTGAAAAVLGVEKTNIPDFILWGDSHGTSAAHALDQAATELNLYGLGYLNNGTPPIPGLWFSDLTSGQITEMEKLNAEVEQKIIESGSKNLILIGRWVARCEGYTDAEVKHQQPNYRYVGMVVNEDCPEPHLEHSPRILIEKIEALARRLSQHGIRISLLQQVPETTSIQTANLVDAQKRFPKFNSLPARTTTLAAHKKRQQKTNDVFAKLDQDLIAIVDPTNAFFPDGEALKIYDDASYYTDDDHLTQTGSLHYLTPVFRMMLEGFTDR